MEDTKSVPFNLVRSKKVVGVKVTNAQNESLGMIEEVVIDKVSGQTYYVVLSFGGIMGLGDKLFALPWQMLHFNQDKDCFEIDVDKDQLKNAPGFDKNDWPNLSDNDWGKTISSYYKDFV